MPDGPKYGPLPFFTAHALKITFTFFFLIVNSLLHACVLSCVQLFATPWTVAHQAPLSLGFSRQEYWRAGGAGFGHGLGFPHGSVGKESACNTEDLGLIPGLGRPLEKEMATCSSILAWIIPWTE